MKNQILDIYGEEITPPLFENLLCSADENETETEYKSTRNCLHSLNDLLTFTDVLMEEHGIFGNDSKKRIRKLSGNATSSKLNKETLDRGSDNKRR